MADTECMSLVAELAERGCGWVNPNPTVGAVIVRDGQIIGQGYHKKYGALHTERNALMNCESPPIGVTIHVTPEPCCHYGGMPPCTDVILGSGIRQVMIGPHGPSPQVLGKGTVILCSHGIEVTENRLKGECDALNQSFLHYIRKGTPYAVIKYVMTLDGRIVTHQGKPQ